MWHASSQVTLRNTVLRVSEQWLSDRAELLHAVALQLIKLSK
jgi:hypothetical protein